jgi:predicted NBD/HSP70 family sugar kinase
MVINIGWGIGLGLIINQELYRGENGFAGEFSHLPLFNNEKLCGCGKKGCLETEASLLVVWERALAGLKAGRSSVLRELDPEHCETFIEGLLVAAAKGDQFTIELLSEAGYNIGRGVAVLIHLLNPELILISGRGANPGLFWQTPIQQALNEYCIPRLSAGTTIKVSKLGYQAGLIGAAALVMENFDLLEK